MDCATCPHADAFKRYDREIEEIKKQAREDADKNYKDHIEFRENVNEVKLINKDTQSDVKVMNSTLMDVKKAVEETKNAPSKYLYMILAALTGATISFVFGVILKFIT